MEDSSADVNEFLLRIRELGDKRLKEDEDRARKLEEEILQGRKERQARRAERARSISPTKDFPPSSSSPTASISSLPKDHKSISQLPPSVLWPSSSSLDCAKDTTGESDDRSQDPASPATPAVNQDEPSSPSTREQPEAMLEQRGKLDKVGPRPLEPTGTLRNINGGPSSAEDVGTPSRSQISQLLSSKDPTWFRQTSDRERSSLALRKSSENTITETSSSEATFKLPGMNRESSETSSTEAPKSRDWITTTSDRLHSPSRSSATFATTPGSAGGNRYSSISSVSTSGLGSPIPLSAPRLDARKSESQPFSEDRLPVSPGRASPERSSSPTKGLGGFVQSAMLKRSDSISKRWTVQSPANLSRSNSILSNRSGAGLATFGGDLLASPAEPKPLRESSPLSLSRPSSSHSEATIIQASRSQEEKDNVQEKPQLDSPFVKPSLPIHSRSSFTSTSGLDDTKSVDEPQTPRSPSKSFDQKRWSPTKSSWLESALNRPESPRAKPTVVTQQQPTWMRDLSKARQSRASVDLGRPAANQQTSPASIVRSPGFGGHSRSSSTSPVKTAHPLSPPEKQPSSPKEDNARSSSVDVNAGVETLSTTKSEAVVDEDIKVTSSTPESKVSPPVPPNKPKTVSTLNLGSNWPSTTDFRASLRRREVANDKTTSDEPEFKNVFGKLRKTEKSTYKAPDVLKDNITRGKAALNITGGPKKTERVDEFKESILKQKDAMKAGGGSIRRTTEEDRNLPKTQASIPEALAKRNNLVRTDSARTNLGALPASSPTRSIDRVDMRRPLSGSRGPDSKPDSVSPPLQPITKVPTVESRPGPKSDVKDTSENKIPDSKVLPTKLSPKDGKLSKDSSVSPLSSRAAEKTSSESNELSAKGTIAGRLNPGLAGILARGPPRNGESIEKASFSSPKTSAEAVQASPATPLTHMTKSRARGPKRRLPASAASEAKPTEKKTSPKTSTGQAKVESEVEEQEASTEYVRSLSVPAKKIAQGSEPVIERHKPLILVKPPDVLGSSVKAPASKGTVAEQVGATRGNLEMVSANTFSKKTIGEISKPSVPPKSTPVRKPSANSTVKTTSTANSTPEGAKNSHASRAISPAVPAKTIPSREGSTHMDKNSSLSDNRPTPPPKPLASPLGPSSGNSSPSPSPSFASRLKETLAYPASMSPIQAKFGLGLGSSFFQPRPSSPLEVNRNPSQTAKPATPPIPPKKNLSISAKLTNEIQKPSLTSPIPRTTESIEVISEFFDVRPNSNDRVVIDPQLILNAEEDSFKIRTLRKQIWEITGDGKKQDLPKHQDYILFEGSMYVCVHSFECEARNENECYLWLGDEVSEAAMQDAQLFARRVARENGTKLEIVRQGKESAKFIEALGGILITRRGSSSRSSSSAIYMLCGRRHLGQIAFDEVDFSRGSLCSGFTYVISAKFGKLYLWKGKGSGADELGSARLVGMDIGLTGEMEEICEGAEQDSFWDIFPQLELEPGDVRPATLDYWDLKPRHEKHRHRLLRVDHVLGQKGGFWNRRGSSSPVTRPNDTIQEIEPYAQKDLLPQGIYILDTFFEIYVIVGSDAKSRAAEFASALVFAHEYGVLAASLQDRPFIPVGYVSIGGLPASCTMVFRKWDPKLWPTTNYVLPLNAAIEAIRC